LAIGDCRKVQLQNRAWRLELLKSQAQIGQFSMELRESARCYQLGGSDTLQLLTWFGAQEITFAMRLW